MAELYSEQFQNGGRYSVPRGGWEKPALRVFYVQTLLKLYKIDC